MASKPCLRMCTKRARRKRYARISQKDAQSRELDVSDLKEADNEIRAIADHALNRFDSYNNAASKVVLDTDLVTKMC